MTPENKPILLEAQIAALKEEISHLKYTNENQKKLIEENWKTIEKLESRPLGALE